MTDPFVDALADAIEGSGHLPCHASEQVNRFNALGIAEALIPTVTEIASELMVESYHPEFGTEWREPDGSLYKILNEVENRVKYEERLRIARNLGNAMSRFQDDEEIADVWADEILRVWHPTYH